MTSARPTRQTACVTERRAASGGDDLTPSGSSCLDDTTPTGGDAIAFKKLDGRSITGTSATYVDSVGGEDFLFSKPGNGWATVDHVP